MAQGRSATEESCPAGVGTQPAAERCPGRLAGPRLPVRVPALFTLPSACTSLPRSPSCLPVCPCLLHPPVWLNRELQPRKQDVVMGAALTFPAGPGFFSSLCTWKAVLGDPSAPSVCLLSGRLLRLWFGVCFHCCNFALSFAPPFVGWRRI